MTIQIEKYRPSSSIHIIWGAMALVILIAIWTIRDMAVLAPPCPFHELTGLPCLTCGATRSAVSLSMFDLPSSLKFNPLLPIFFLGIVLFSIVHLEGFVLKKRIVLGLAAPDRKIARIAIFGLLAANWIYLVAAGI